ncbi:MAG TPA: hypothetical protein PLX35_02285 [Cyclobacteriaceae bacterium]|nr:hypothetical protein [Cyclobacteriaceae bacterium]
MSKLRLACLALLTCFASYADAQTVAVEVPETELIPEGIALDSTTGKFYLTSIAKNKIIEISRGQPVDFIQSGQYGFVGGLGIHIDYMHHMLWACSGDFNGHAYTTGIFAFDPTTKQLLRKFLIPTDTTRNFFNDLAVADNGDIFITNSDDNSIWQWKHKAPHPEKMKLPAVVEPNGIVWDKSRSLLFVATRNGLVALSPPAKTLHILAMPNSETSTGLDGLVFYKNSIISVRNGFRDKSKHAVIRYYLSRDGLSIVRTEIIDQSNPLFDIPTTLTIRGSQLFVIANSQMDLLDDQKHINHSHAVKKPVILKYTLPQ